MIGKVSTHPLRESVIKPARGDETGANSLDLLAYNRAAALRRQSEGIASAMRVRIRDLPFGKMLPTAAINHFLILGLIFR